MSDYDAIIIGAGHNGLTCAAYLARAGLNVKVLEQRGVIGGATVTEEFHPGFRNSVYSYGISLLSPDVIRELELHKHGLEILERPAGTISLLDNDYLLLPRDSQAAKQQIARFSKHDAELIDEFEQRISDVALLLRKTVNITPPNIGGGWKDLLQALKMGNHLRGFDATQQATFAELMSKSLGDYLDMWFEGEALKGVLGLEGVIGNFAEPYQANTAYVLLHHAFGEVNGRNGAWGIARGGMGAVSGAIASYARSHGVDIETDCAVEKILTESGRVSGVVTKNGNKLSAPVVAGNIHPQTLLLKMLDPALLSSDQKRRLNSYRSHSATFRMNVALSELPVFDSLPESSNAVLSGAIEICPSLTYIKNAFNDANSHGWAKQPVISMWIPTTQDDTLAPSGCHVASLFCQHFHKDLPQGQSWDEVKEEVADLIIDTIAKQSSNFKSILLGRQIKSPLDIERDLGMLGGDIFHGALHLDQLASLRPITGLADYRMPAKGLYLCGSGSHPGGGVSAIPGRNASREILSDLKRK
ncbi:MAG: FAD-dependent oxidoreductase [Gammaproteobacteria bacterium]|nr:FAD-dependent oxidoreductase [Gammaproteobacteria bacterium]